MQKYWPERRYRGKDNIWTGINTATKENVIIKFFPKDTVDDYKVSREAYTMRYLFNEDPNHFLELYDFMEDNNDNQYMIAMERAECSLEDILNERGFIPEYEAIPIIREILYALKVMHKNNYIHRDLKLSNILLRSRNNPTSVTIIDFGETLDRTDDYQVSGMVGTLHYMAPEILKKKKYGKPVDIWAFGVITYRLLTGYFPYMTEGNNHSKQLKAILNNKISFLCYDDKRLSVKAIDFINCLLDKDPQSRISIQDALEHPFLNPDLEEEFIPYKPIPKFPKKMSKENMKDGKPMNMKQLFSKAVKMSKKQDIVGESEKIIKTLFTKENEKTEEYVEPTENYEEQDPNCNIRYSKTSVQPSKKPMPYSNGGYNSSGPFATQTINRIPKNHNNNNIPEYLNITLGRNNRYQRCTDEDEQNNYDYDNVKFSNSYVPPTGATANTYIPFRDKSSNNYVPPTGNTAGNVNNQYQPPTGNTAGNVINQYQPPTGNTAGNVVNQYQPPTGNTAGNVNDNYGYNNVQVNYSKTYAPSRNNNYNNNSPNLNYSKTCLSPKLPKTAGNTIDPYNDYPSKPMKTAGNTIDPYATNDQNQNNNNNNNQNLLPNGISKPPKTAGNSIDPYAAYNNNPLPIKAKKTAGNINEPYSELQKINVFDEKHNTRHNRAYSDSCRKVENNEEYYQNYRDKYDNNSAVKNQFNAKYNGELGKSNTVTGATSGRPKNNYNSSPLHDAVSVKSDDYKYFRKEKDNDSIHSHHRRTSSSGSHPSLDDDIEREQRRRSGSAGNRPKYDDDYDRDHRRTSSSGSRPKYDDDYERDRNHHRRSGSSGSRHKYNDDYERDRDRDRDHHRRTGSSGSRHKEDDYERRHRRTSSSGSRPKFEDEYIRSNHRQRYDIPDELTPLKSSPKMDHSKPARPSPLSNAATIKTSDIKLKVNLPKHLPKFITVDQNHPERNSSLKTIKKKK